MSRDFILVFSGGMVSLVTTLVVLFVADFLYRRTQTNQTEKHPVHPPETISSPQSEKLEPHTINSVEEHVQ